MLMNFGIKKMNQKLQLYWLVKRNLRRSKKMSRRRRYKMSLKNLKKK
jgi:hypothetical protein